MDTNTSEEKRKPMKLVKTNLRAFIFNCNIRPTSARGAKRTVTTFGSSAGTTANTAMVRTASSADDSDVSKIDILQDKKPDKKG